MYLRTRLEECGVHIHIHIHIHIIRFMFHHNIILKNQIMHSFIIIYGTAVVIIIYKVCVHRMNALTFISTIYICILLLHA